MKPIRIALLVLAAATAVALAGVGRPEPAGGADDQTLKGITVTGVGTAKAVPDEAEFTLNVQAEGDTAREALAANADRMQRLLTALKRVGVERANVKTQDISVSPNYSEGGQPSGYVAGNSVSVRIHHLAKAGRILDVATKAGAENVYGPSLRRSDRAELEGRALRSAFENAKANARALARAAGVRVGRVTAIVESSADTPEPMYFDAARATTLNKTPLAPGTEDVRANVNVTFAIE